MKIAKSYKILILLATFVLAISAAFGSMSFSVVKADVQNPDASNYLVSTVEDVSATFSFDEENGGLVAKMKQGSAFEFKNKLVVDDFAISFSIDSAISALTLDLSYDSFYLNGNKNAQGGFDKTIKQSINLTSANQLVAISYDNGYLIVKVDGGANVAKANDAYYKINVVDKPIVKLGFTATTVTDENGANVKINFVDQKTTANGYKQSFELQDGKLTKALPRIVLNNSFFTGNATVGYSLVKTANKSHSVTVTPYSVIGDKASDMYIAESDDVKLVGSESSKMFKIVSTSKIGQKVELNIVDKADTSVVLEKFEINVVNGDKDSGEVDSVAPQYIDAVDNALAYQAYQAAVEKAIMVEDGSHHVGLGYDLELPTMQDLVYDNCTAYEDLKVTLTHISTTTSTASKLEFTISNVGNYLFYAVFSDAFDNKMDAKEIYDKEEVEKTGILTAQVFGFVMVEDAPLIVESFGGEGLGYKGVSYKAPAFKIDASGCTTTYKLYFNPSKTVAVPADSEELTAENGWVVIPKASSVTDKNYNKDGYNYDSIKSIAYEGLSFIPNKVGTYVIECSAVSKVTSKSSTGFSLVRVNESTTIKLPSNWLKNNVWSVVFLSIGTLCLAGIIVLLCIKPKEEIDQD